jgi:chaperonin cofactor prefoldin
MKLRRKTMYGKWSAYKIIAEDDSGVYEIDTVDGVRGIDISVKINISSSGIWNYETKQGHQYEIKKVKKIIFDSNENKPIDYSLIYSTIGYNLQFGDDEKIKELEKRIELLENEVERLRKKVWRINDEDEYSNKLKNELDEQEKLLKQIQEKLKRLSKKE